MVITIGLPTPPRRYSDADGTASRAGFWRGNDVKQSDRESSNTQKRCGRNTNKKCDHANLNREDHYINCNSLAKPISLK